MVTMERAIKAVTESNQKMECDNSRKLSSFSKQTISKSSFDMKSLTRCQSSTRQVGTILGATNPTKYYWIYAIVLLCGSGITQALPVEPGMDIAPRTSEEDLEIPRLESLLADFDITNDYDDFQNYGSQPEEITSGVPRVEESKRGKYTKCKKGYRKNYCMNGAKCEWIPEINRPRCHCKNGWKGERCRTYHLDFTGNDKTDQQVLVISLVVCFFGVLGLMLVGCIVWRRVRYVQEHRAEEEENSQMMKNELQNEQEDKLTVID